jgi:AcrR family transcriptional regulator
MPDETDRRAIILSAAFDEFAAHGFKGATIKGIAKAARLQSQALIYWYFPTKEALFQSVIESRLPFLQSISDPAPLMDLPPELVLPQLARSYLHTFEQPLAPRLAKLLVPEVLRRPEVADIVGRRVVARVLSFLTTYLDHQITLGRLRPHDTRSGARAFMGMLLPQVAGMIVLPALRDGGPTNDEHVDTTVDIFLRGLRPDQG